MSEKKSDEKFANEHEYDGIQELDNPLPKWWLFTFYITIIFSVFYIPYYHFLGGQNPRDEYKEQLAVIEGMKKAAPQPEQGSGTLDAALTDSKIKKLGEGVFTTKCVACHGNHAQGVIGPNLTDDYWINGDGTSKAILGIIRAGVPSKGMPPWGQMLTSDELIQVAAYVVSLRGTLPANPKPPQGQLFKSSAGLAKVK
jgi:cytochrome c oxidase cbb3-type subunit 3